ncbi:hypothetical protein ANN_10613 [Periplaneta americana]|uniref:Uncharacterized protein n=1 Tax=Periplaneta americana TaxID=6978 RepID=A0ABQ8TSN0_PERAM|nr:hypothetical protein ANN_10613 [Periplaneta americana]
MAGLCEGCNEPPGSLKASDNAGEMSPGSNTDSYPAFARVGLRENPGKNLNQNVFGNKLLTHYDSFLNIIIIIAIPHYDYHHFHLYLFITSVSTSLLSTIADLHKQMIIILQSLLSQKYVLPNLQRIPNLTEPVDNNDVTLQRNRNKTAGRIDGCHGDCQTHRHDTTVHDVIRLLIPALYKNQSDSLMAADGDCHHLCKLMAPVRHRWSINDVIGEIRNTVMPSDCSPIGTSLYETDIQHLKRQTSVVPLQSQTVPFLSGWDPERIPYSKSSESITSHHTPDRIGSSGDNVFIGSRTDIGEYNVKDSQML